MPTKQIPTLVLLAALAGCLPGAGKPECIIIDFPHGATRLHVWSNGEARLFYGARAQNQRIQNGTFRIDDLYDQLRPRLHENLPREQRPDPEAACGMVTLIFKNSARDDHLIYDGPFAESLFQKARQHLIDAAPGLF